MLSAFKRRIAGIRAELGTAKQTADEMLKIHGDGVWAKFVELERAAWRRSALTEFLFWKMTREYAREIQKNRDRNTEDHKN